MDKLTISIVILALSNFLAWFQLNGQFLWKNSPFWTNGIMMAIFGLPIGYMFFHATKLSYEHFGYVWNIRLIGFGLGNLIFAVMTWGILGEIPNWKTGICLVLAFTIILIQLVNK